MTLALIPSLLLLFVALASLARRLATHAFNRRVCEREAALLALAPAGQLSHEALIGLPEPARRYLSHTIGTGAPLARRVRLKVQGEVRLVPLGQWLPFEAKVVLAPKAGALIRVRLGRGARAQERVTLVDGERAAVGHARFGLPALRSDDDDALGDTLAGHLAIGCIWLPSAFSPALGARWEPMDDERARVTVDTLVESAPLIVHVYDDGSLRGVSTWIDVPFEVKATPLSSAISGPLTLRVDEEERFGRYLLPSRVRATRGAGTPRAWEFLRVQLLEADLYT